MIDPVTRIAVLSSRSRKTESAVIDFPEPDSPTNATVCVELTRSDTSWSTCTSEESEATESGCGNQALRSFIRSIVKRGRSFAGELAGAVVGIFVNVSSVLRFSIKYQRQSEMDPELPPK